MHANISKPSGNWRATVRMKYTHEINFLQQWNKPMHVDMKSLNSKTDISIFINLRLKLLKNIQNNKKICHIFHNFKNIPCYVMSEASLKTFYFALFDDGLTLKTLKLAFIGFWIQTLHMVQYLTMLHSWYFNDEFVTAGQWTHVKNFF